MTNSKSPRIAATDHENEFKIFCQIKTRTLTHTAFFLKFISKENQFYKSIKIKIKLNETRAFALIFNFLFIYLY